MLTLIVAEWHIVCIAVCNVIVQSDYARGRAGQARRKLTIKFFLAGPPVPVAPEFERRNEEESMYRIKISRRSAALSVALAALCIAWPARTIFLQAYGPPTQPPAPAADQNVAPQPAAAETNAGVEPLTSGPVHEAFAEPLDYNAVKPLVVSQEPPAAIEEVPPEAKPEGTNVIWIPGYWGWDDDRRSFIWISGIWRDAPPGEVWVSGYWTPISGGNQWVPGFWTSAETQQVSYLPEPPAAPTETASTPSPGDNYFSVPGNWLYADG